VGDTSWAFLLVGTFAAFGAAMAVGTIGALVRYHRTGTLPGTNDVVDVPTGRYVALWLRVAVGIVLTVIGVVALARAGLL